MPKGRLLGAGRVAEVYEWDAGRVVKLFRDGFPREWVRLEAEAGRLARQAGLPAPAVGELVELEGRPGYVCERVAGPSLLAQLQRRPWRTGWAGRVLARLHHRMHSAPAPAALPRLRERLAGNVRDARRWLEGDVDRVLAVLESLPDAQSICHFDFHPDNVLGQEDGLRVIDWLTAGVGPPAMDVARTLLLLETPLLPPGFPAALRPAVRGLKRWFAAAYRAEVLRLSGLAPAEVEAWRAPVAAARLWEEVPGEREWLVGLVRQGLLSSARSPAPAR